MGETLKDELRELKEIIIEDKKEKKKEKQPRLSWKARAGNRKQAQGYVGIWKINENGFITPSRAKIEEQTVMIDGIPRLATPEYVLRYKKGFRTFPLIIQPSWSVEPFSPTRSYNQSMLNGSNAKGYKLLMNRMKLDTVGKLKGQVGGLLKWIIGLGLGGIILYAILTSGGG